MTKKFIGCQWKLILRASCDGYSPLYEVNFMNCVIIKRIQFALCGHNMIIFVVDTLKHNGKMH